MLRALFLVSACALLAQDPAQPGADPLPPASISEKWNLFEHETFTPLTLGAAGFNATVSQAFHIEPLYGRHPWPYAYPKRFGAALGDITSQNFFSDFLLASAFHEDTRYVRQGSARKFWSRVAYAISRSVVTRTDAGGTTFNWANVLGTAMSAGLSNAYYPARSRTASAAARNWGSSVADTGFVNLLPELWPDFRHWVGRHLLRSRR